MRTLTRWAIVAAALGFLTSSALAFQADVMPPADQVIYHARVITVDREFSTHQTVAIKGDRIVSVGSEADIAAWIGPNTRLIDAGGKSLLPGLYDSHVHPLGAATSEVDHPIPVYDSLEAILSYVAERSPGATQGNLDRRAVCFSHAIEGKPVSHSAGARCRGA